MKHNETWIHSTLTQEQVSLMRCATLTLLDRADTFQFVVLSQSNLNVISVENTNLSPTVCIQIPSSLNKKQLPTMTLLFTPGGRAFPTESHQTNW